MAIQRVDGYVYSCAGCGAVYHRRRRRGDALQDQLDHGRTVEADACHCWVIDGRRHHTIVCEASHLRPAVVESGPFSPGVTP